jgi:hypothetical protein
MEQRAESKFCVKLKKTATEICSLLKSEYGEEYLNRTTVFEGSKKGSESVNEKSQVKTLLSVFSDAKGNIHH